MEEKNEDKSSDVMKAIEQVVAAGGRVTDTNGNEGVDLLAIVKKIHRNRKKGESLE